MVLKHGHASHLMDLKESILIDAIHISKCFQNVFIILQKLG